MNPSGHGFPAHTPKDFTSISLANEIKPALAADSQDQGAEHEAREKLHGAEMREEARGDRGSTGTLLLAVHLFS